MLRRWRTNMNLILDIVVVPFHMEPIYIPGLFNRMVLISNHLKEQEAFVFS